MNIKIHLLFEFSICWINGGDHISNCSDIHFFCFSICFFCLLFVCYCLLFCFYICFINWRNIFNLLDPADLADQLLLIHQVWVEMFFPLWLYCGKHVSQSFFEFSHSLNPSVRKYYCMLP